MREGSLGVGVVFLHIQHMNVEHWSGENPDNQPSLYQYAEVHLIIKYIVNG